MPVLLGLNDSTRPAGLFDTMEGAYNSGSGSGVGHRIPVSRVYEDFSGVASNSFSTASRVYKLFTAGHEIIVSYKPPASDATTNGYTKVSNGSQDAAIHALGGRIYGLPFNTAVSGTQPGVSYGGTTATKVRVIFHHEPENETGYGTATEFKAAYRHFMKELKSRRPTGALERIISLPCFIGDSNGNGKAALWYPGNTAADFCDEIGADPYVKGNYIDFGRRVDFWLTWVTNNGAGRKLCIPEVGTLLQTSTFIGTIVPKMLIEPRLTAVCWFSSPFGNFDRSTVAKSVNADVWQAMVDAVAAAYAGSQPVDTTAPPAPVGLSSLATTSSTVTLQWQQPHATDLAGYKLTRDGTLLATITNPSTVTYVVSGQTPGTSHAYRIASFDAASPPNVSAFVGPQGTNVPLTVTHPQIAEPDPPQVDPTSGVTVNGYDAALNLVATDPASGTLTVTVDWGDGSTGAGAAATHSYATAGTYQVTVVTTSSASAKSATTSFSVVIQEQTNSDERTDGTVSLYQPIEGQPVGEFGPKFRLNNQAVTDAFEDLLQDRQVQNGEDDPFLRRPILSVTGGTFTDEPPGDTYIDGRTLLAITAGGGGTVADGSITPTKLSFDPATQAELNAAVAGLLPVGYSDPAKVGVGEMARSQAETIGGFFGLSFDPAAMSNNAGMTVAAGTVVWASFTCTASGNAAQIYFYIVNAGSGSGYTIRLHNSSTFATIATANSGVDAQMTSSGISTVGIPSTAVVRGQRYYVSWHCPTGVTSAPSLRSSWMDTGMNFGGTTGDRAGTAAASSAPTTLPYGSAAVAKLALVGVK